MRAAPSDSHPLSVRIILRDLPVITRYTVRDARWTLPDLTIAFVSDLHVGGPWVTLGYIARMVAQTNALGADMILLGGDYVQDRNMRHFSRRVLPDAIAKALRPLRAPLGVHGVLGNHDWKGATTVSDDPRQPNPVAEAFTAAGLPLMRNANRFIPFGPTGFWLVGTDSQRAIRQGNQIYTSFLDADSAFAGIPAGAPVIHLAHEPDYFNVADPRAFLQLSGHTHGGQIKINGRTPVVPSDFGDRYAYGYVKENDNHLIVCGGIGFSGLPLRVGRAPEIVLVTVGR